MQVFETPGSVSLRFRLPSGRVVVTTADEPRTSVELVPLGRRGTDAIENVEVLVSEAGDGHVITVDEKDRIRWGPLRITWGADVEVRVTCPPGADLDLSGGSTDLRADGVLGEVSARSASGDIKLETVAKKLQAKTASGDISIRAIEAGGSAVTVSGDLDIGRVESTLSARSVSGDARIRSVRAPLTLSTTSGDVELESVEAGDVRVQSVSGDVRIGVARGTRVFIDATSVSGSLTSELGLADDEPAPESSEGEAAPEASPVVPLHVKTVSGDVSLVRAAAVPAV
jgi:Putative adhesin